MNYPFTKQSSALRRISLILVAAFIIAALSGCSLLPSSGNETEATEEVTEATVVTEAPTEAPTAAPTEAPTTASKENVAIVKEQINMRQTPSTGARVITALDAGDELEVIRLETIGTVGWAYVNSISLDVQGWVTTAMLDLSNVTLTSGGSSTPGNTSTSETDAATSVSETTSADPTTATVDSITGKSSTATTSGKYGVVTASELNIRSSASQTGDRVGSYSYGDRISVLETSNGWGRTDKGWISLSYVYMEGDVGANAAYGTVTATQLNVRSGPGTNYERVKSLSQGERVQVLQQITIGTTTWGYVSGGWASMDYITPEGSAGSTSANAGTTTTTGVGTGVITATAVNVRAGAGQSYDVVGSKSMGEVVTILETATAEGYTWGRTDVGWICMNYVSMNG